MKKSELRRLIREVVEEMGQDQVPQHTADQKQNLDDIMEPVVRDILTKMQKDNPEDFRKILPHFKSKEKVRGLLNHPKVQAASEKIKKSVDWEDHLDTLSVGAVGLARGARDVATSEKGKKAIKFAGKTGKLAFVAFMKTIQLSVKSFGALQTIIGLGFLLILAKSAPTLVGSIIELVIKIFGEIVKLVFSEGNIAK